MNFIINLFATTLIKKLLSEILSSFSEDNKVKKPEDLDTYLAQAKAKRLLMNIQRRKNEKR